MTHPLLQTNADDAMVAPEEDLFVLVEDFSSAEDADDDEGFVLTGEQDLVERGRTVMEDCDDEDGPFVLVAETLDRIMEEQNNENEQTRRSAFIALTVIAAYLYALMGITTIVSLLRPSASSSWWQRRTPTPSPLRHDVLQDILQTKLHEATTVEFPAPSIFIPTIAHGYKSQFQPFVGYPVVPPRAYSFSELQVPRRADYSIYAAEPEEEDANPYMPSPSPPPRKNSSSNQVAQVRFSAAAYASPPKVEPIQLEEAVPFPSIASPWSNHDKNNKDAVKSTALMIPTRRFPSLNQTTSHAEEETPSVTAPKAKPMLLPRHHHPGALGIPTVMRIPFSPTFHIPHAASNNAILLWPAARMQNETAVPATAPPKDPSILSYEHVLAAFFSASIGSELDAWWKKLQESVDSVPSVRIDCATLQQDEDDALDHLCPTSTVDSTASDRPSLYLLHRGQVVQKLPFRHHIDNILVHLERAVAGQTATTSTAPVTLRSTPLTDDSFPAFIDTHRFSIVVFYHPTQQTTRNASAVWRTFHQHQGPGRATVNCQAYPTTCRQYSTATLFPRLQRYRYGRAVVVEEDEEDDEDMGDSFARGGRDSPTRPTQHVSAM